MINYENSAGALLRNHLNAMPSFPGYLVIFQAVAPQRPVNTLRFTVRTSGGDALPGYVQALQGFPRERPSDRMGWAVNYIPMFSAWREPYTIRDYHTISGPDDSHSLGFWVSIFYEHLSDGMQFFYSGYGPNKITTYASLDIYKENVTNLVYRLPEIEVVDEWRSAPLHF